MPFFVDSYQLWNILLLWFVTRDRDSTETFFAHSSTIFLITVSVFHHFAFDTLTHSHPRIYEYNLLQGNQDEKIILAHNWSSCFQERGELSPPTKQQVAVQAEQEAVLPGRAKFSGEADTHTPHTYSTHLTPSSSSEEELWQSVWTADCHCIGDDLKRGTQQHGQYPACTACSEKWELIPAQMPWVTRVGTWLWWPLGQHHGITQALWTLCSGYHQCDAEAAR